MALASQAALRKGISYSAGAASRTNDHHCRPVRSLLGRRDRATTLCTLHQHEHAVEAPLRVSGDRARLTGEERSRNRSEPVLDDGRQLNRLPLNQARAGTGHHSRPTYLARDSLSRGMSAITHILGSVHEGIRSPELGTPATSAPGSRGGGSARSSRPVPPCSPAPALPSAPGQ